ncbi:DUF1939 domain-containing protein [bacterium SCSIO 12643]|nr:DUF1939 domain-containing protein [bacterium SCSIO 12643]
MSCCPRNICPVRVSRSIRYRYSTLHPFILDYTGSSGWKVSVDNQGWIKTSWDTSLIGRNCSSISYRVT